MSSGIESIAVPDKSSGVPTVVVAGLATARVTGDQLAEMMVEDCLAARGAIGTRPKVVFSSNGQGIALAGADAEFSAAMYEADIIHADGMPVVLASKLTGTPLPERIATTDFFHNAAIAAVRSGLSFFVLGATEKQNSAAVDAMVRLYPSLKIAGRHHGYIGPEDDERVSEMIVESGADVVWVALGKPRQEYWCVRNRERLTGVGWIKTCGGLYAFLAGDVRRAPTWMQRLGLEWLYRALEDPRRLGWRYLTTNPRALYRLIRYTNRSTEK